MDDYLRNMAIDKKAEHGIPVFVVLNGLGHAATTRADEALVRAVIADHLRQAVAREPDPWMLS